MTQKIGEKSDKNVEKTSGKSDKSVEKDNQIVLILDPEKRCMVNGKTTQGLKMSL